MPYLPTSQAFLEQSCLLLEAYPTTTRITTKYSFPPSRRRLVSRKELNKTSNPASGTELLTPDFQQSQQQQDGLPPSRSDAAGPVASLTLKTYDPTSGICLKYRTNKAAEVGRLVTTLGKLAAGADVTGLGLSATAHISTVPGPAATAATDVEMVDAAGAREEIPATSAGGTSKGGNGKAKKKGGKGKR